MSGDRLLAFRCGRLKFSCGSYLGTTRTGIRAIQTLRKCFKRLQKVRSLLTTSNILFNTTHRPLCAPRAPVLLCVTNRCVLE